MRDIKNYTAAKYSSGDYSAIEDGIYKIEENGEIIYVTSLSFTQEEEWEEGANASEISQYPLAGRCEKPAFHYWKACI